MRKNKLITFLVPLAILSIVIAVFLNVIYVPPILTYHAIDDNYNKTKLSVCPAGFAKQMDFFYRHKYNVISLEKLVGLIKSKSKIPSKTVCITFDDGFMNNYECAYPVLKKYGFPATIFVITGKIGQDGYMGWEELKELENNNISIGCHTVSHKWLPSMTVDQLRTEIAGAKKTLESGLGKEVKFIAYPMGAYDYKVQAAVKEAGFIGACGTNPGPHKRWDDIYALKRIRISRTADNPWVLWIESSGFYTFIKEKRDSV